jgi:hypothetical protein
MSAPEPLWHWWQRMMQEIEPVRLQASDTLRLVISDRSTLPVQVQRKGYRGLDHLKAQIKNGVPGVILRRTPS